MADSCSETNLYWTTKELAEKAHVDPSYIRQLLLAKRIRGIKRGRDWLIPIHNAEQWLRERE